MLMFVCGCACLDVLVWMCVRACECAHAFVCVHRICAGMCMHARVYVPISGCVYACACMVCACLCVCVCAGGVVSGGEDTTVSATRELQEEMGVTNTPLTYLFDFKYADEATKVCVCVCVQAVLCV